MGYLHHWVQTTIHIGKSETAFNLRLNNHRNHIKKGISSCELTEHFLHNKRTHNFDNNVIITIIEQHRKDNISNKQKKDLLRHREICWQKKLNSMQPNELNKRIVWSFNIIAVILTKFWVHKMFLTYAVRVANYRKSVIDVHTQLCYTIKQFTDEITFNT